jgi:hypothetical protein
LWLQYLDVDPARHPLVDSGLSLVDQTEVQKQLHRATDTGLKSGGNPGMGVGCVLADEDELLWVSMLKAQEEGAREHRG